MQARTVTVVSSVLAAAVLSVFLVDHAMAKRAQQGDVKGGVARVRSALFRPSSIQDAVADTLVRWPNHQIGRA